MICNGDIKSIKEEMIVNYMLDSDISNTKQLEAISGVSVNCRGNNLVILGDPRNKQMKQVLKTMLLDTHFTKIKIVREGDLAQLYIQRKLLNKLDLEIILSMTTKIQRKLQ